MLDLDQLKNEAEEAIRAGNRENARAILSGLKGIRIPRAKASVLATLARRAGLLPLALKIMAQIIRPKVPLDIEATDEEKSTYAIILLGVGASTEALEILGSGNPQNPEVNLALAFTHINRWDYAAAVPFLRHYLSIDGIVPYQRMIARVNLAAAFVALGEVREGRPLLEQILTATQENHWNLLHKNGLELSAQLAIQERDWPRASQYLARAAQGADQSFNLDDFFIRKWTVVMDLLRDGPKSESVAAMRELRAVAVQNNHWETTRDCDYQLALATKDETLLERVYFGTPFASFRQRIHKHTGDWFSPSGRYVWQMQPEPSSRIFDLGSGEESVGTAKTKPGKGLHKALQTLASDFYKPFVIGSLHSALFPNEYFNPDSSPRRVGFLIHRLRDWMTDHKIPLAIRAGKEGYSLEALAPYAFCLSDAEASHDTEVPAHYQVMITKVKQRFGEKSFSAPQVAELLDVSLRTARYFLSWALTNKKLKRLGTGRSTQYRVGR